MFGRLNCLPGMHLYLTSKYLMVSVHGLPKTSLVAGTVQLSLLSHLTRTALMLDGDEHDTDFTESDLHKDFVRRPQFALIMSIQNPGPHVMFIVAYWHVNDSLNDSVESGIGVVASVAVVAYFKQIIFNFFWALCRY